MCFTPRAIWVLHGDLAELWGRPQQKITRWYIDCGGGPVGGDSRRSKFASRFIGGLRESTMRRGAISAACPLNHAT